MSRGLTMRTLVLNATSGSSRSSALAGVRRRKESSRNATAASAPVGPLVAVARRRSAAYGIYRTIAGGCDPIEIRAEPGRDRHRDDLGQLVRVHRPQRAFDARVCLGGRLDDEGE